MADVIEAAGEKIRHGTSDPQSMGKVRESGEPLLHGVLVSVLLLGVCLCSKVSEPEPVALVELRRNLGRLPLLAGRYTWPKYCCVLTQCPAP